MAGTSGLQVLGQQASGTVGTSGSFYNGQQYGPDSEAWLTVTTKPVVDNDWISLYLRLQNPSSATAGGYQAYFYNRTGTDEYRIGKRVNGALSVLAYVAGPELQAGDQLLFRVVGTRLDLIRGHGGTWTNVLSATDTTFPSAGYIGVGAKNNALRIDDFGGGTYQ
jgi:hypothetical protein